MESPKEVVVPAFPLRRGRGRPKGSRNKPRVNITEAIAARALTDPGGAFDVVSSDLLPLTKKSRWENLQTAIESLTASLGSNGFSDALRCSPYITPSSREIEDPKTGAKIAHVEEPLGSYLQRVSVRDNYSQRQAYDHTQDPIYRRLIRDFIEGAVMPESKIAALSKTGSANKALSLSAGDVYYSVIDGLQRLYCYGIAVLLVNRGPRLVQEQCLTQEAWEYFKDTLTKLPDPVTATNNLLARTIRYEIFYRVDLAGLLHYMVTFNTGQRRMSMQNQLEIMQKPLLQQLERRSNIRLYHTLSAAPGDQRPKERFSAPDIIMATQAFLSANVHVNAGKETERFLDTERHFLEEAQDVDSVLDVFGTITSELHPLIVERYEEANRRYIMSSGGIMLIGLAAALGFVYAKSQLSGAQIALRRLIGIVSAPGDQDPLRLEEYGRAAVTITSARGKNIRRLIYDTYLRFFSGVTSELAWMNTASMITGT